MTIPKRAIELAIEGGWQPPEFRERTFWHTARNRYRPQQFRTTSASISDAEIALDPTFWQALGKALGWGEKDKMFHWIDMAHRFADVVLTGGDTVKFWEELLAKSVA